VLEHIADADQAGFHLGERARAGGGGGAQSEPASKSGGAGSPGALSNKGS
jgi:hypothetical protein